MDETAIALPFAITVTLLRSCSMGLDVSGQCVYNSNVTGIEFKKLRETIGHTQASLSKEIDVTIRSLTRWETGETPIPKIAELALKYIAERSQGKNKR
jgi:DNA-binding transcriptional regulator YiaG